MDDSGRDAALHSNLQPVEETEDLDAFDLESDDSGDETEEADAHHEVQDICDDFLPALKRPRTEEQVKNGNAEMDNIDILSRPRKKAKVIRTLEERRKKRRGPGTRRNIRNVMQSSGLNEETLKALRDEEERMKRLGNDIVPTIVQNAQIQKAVFSTSKPEQNAKVQEVICLSDSDNEVTLWGVDRDPKLVDRRRSELNALKSGEAGDLDLSDGIEADVEEEGEDIVCVYDPLRSGKRDQCEVDTSQYQQEDFEGETDAEYDEEDTTGASNGYLGSDESVPATGGANLQVLINTAHPSDDPDVFLSPKISKGVKPHQIQGIRFLYSNIVENMSRFKKTAGFGCILGHSMGLGKTLQVVAFSQLLLEYNICNRILIIVPINTVQNWANEFLHWASCDVFDLNTYKLDIAAKDREQMAKSGASERENYLKRYEEITNFVAFTPPEVNDITVYRLSQMCNEWQDMLFDVPILSPQYNSTIIDEMNMLYQNADSDDSKSSDVSSPLILPSVTAETECAIGQALDISGEPVVSDDVDLLPSFDEIRPKSCEPPSIDDSAEKIAESFIDSLNMNNAVSDVPKCNTDSNNISSNVQVANNEVNAKVTEQKEEKKFRVFKISDDCKNNRDRVEVVDQWHSQGGVLLLGYEMFRMLSRLTPSAVKPRCGVKNGDRRVMRTKEEELMDDEQHHEIVQKLHSQLLGDDGPQLVIADEGHRIKNCDSAIAKSLKAIKTKRRVVLTGYPLQNNLIEYWCMVDFVRPNYLGSKVEFSNMFERPISNGQCVDSTAKDIKLMKYRSHVLTSLLRGFVLRRSHSVLIKALPKKTEFIILIRMSPIQRELYRSYLNYVRRRGSGNGDAMSAPQTSEFSSFGANSDDVMNTLQAGVNQNNGQGFGSASGSMGGCSEASLNPIRAFGALCKIWNHPDVLYKAMLEQEGGGSSRGGAPIDYFWAENLMNQYKPGNINDGPKMLLLLEIIRLSVEKRERVLVFSQSLGTLSLIEQCLAKCTVPHTSHIWQRNRDYFRLDGETSATDRGVMINKFNQSIDSDKQMSQMCGKTTDPNGVEIEGNEERKRNQMPSFKENVPWLFLLSTKAGCLGINLVSASRVVIMDVCWNPCHDAQAVCRVFRYGQTRPTFIYRLVANNTMEKRMYDRQVSKQGMSQRIVDELNPQIFLTRNEVERLLDFEEEKDVVDHNISLNKYNDPLLQELCGLYYPVISCSPFEHESLLVDNESKLSVAEKREAREGYQREKQKDQLRPPLTVANFESSNYSNPIGSFNHYKLNSTNQYHVPGQSGGSSTNASLLGLLTGNNRSNHQQQKPVANIRPFSVRSTSGPYNAPRNTLNNQQPNNAPWRTYRNNEVQNNRTESLENEYTLSGDVRIPGNRTYSGEDMVLRAGEQITLSRVPNHPFRQGNESSYFLKTKNGSVFQMDGATAASLMNVLHSSQTSQSSHSRVEESPYSGAGPGHSLFVPETSRGGGGGGMVSQWLGSSQNTHQPFIHTSAYSNKRPQISAVAKHSNEKCNERDPPPLIELSDSD